MTGLDVGRGEEPDVNVCVCVVDAAWAFVWERRVVSVRRSVEVVVEIYILMEVADSG